MRPRRHPQTNAVTRSRPARRSSRDATAATRRAGCPPFLTSCVVNVQSRQMPTCPACRSRPPWTRPIRSWVVGDEAAARPRACAGVTLPNMALRHGFVRGAVGGGHRSDRGGTARPVSRRSSCSVPPTRSTRRSCPTTMRCGARARSSRPVHWIWYFDPGISGEVYGEIALRWRGGGCPHHRWLLRCRARPHRRGVAPPVRPRDRSGPAVPRRRLRCGAAGVPDRAQRGGPRARDRPRPARGRQHADQRVPQRRR